MTTKDLAYGNILKRLLERIQQTINQNIKPNKMAVVINSLVFLLKG